MATGGRDVNMLSDSDLVRQDDNPGADPDLSSDSLDDFDLDSLKNEQSKIDTVLNYLMNFPCPKKSVGRPRRTRTKANASTSGQKSSNNKPPEVSNDNDMPGLGSINPNMLIDYLTSINELNKNLLFFL